MTARDQPRRPAAERVPGYGLPGTDLGQLRKQAKEWLARARSGDEEAVELLRRFHPRGAALGAETRGSVTLADAQLCLARAYGFATWAELRAHLRHLAVWKRSPHRSALSAQEPQSLDDLADAFLKLGCLTYGADDLARQARARAMLERRPDLASHSIHAASAAGSVRVVQAMLDAEPGLVHLEGGPHRWPPLLYLCFSRVGDAPPERSSLAVARLLLDAGADPNAGYLWEGLAPPFTALTGAFGGGENHAHQPPHQHALDLARVLLEAGADANDAQTLYNRMFEEPDDHLRLLFGSGLGADQRGPWTARLGAALQRPQSMLEDQLLWAASWGRIDRVALLLRHGVNPNGRGSGHPTHRGLSATELARASDSSVVVELLRAAGGR